VETRWTGSDKTVYTVYEDPATGAVLEQTYDWPPSVSSVSFSYDLVLSVTRTATIPPDPYLS
jgi:hypothetical protein